MTPPLAAGTIEAAESVWFAANQVRFATPGCVVPAGQAVRKPTVDVCVCVTLRLSEKAAMPVGIPVQGPEGIVYERVSPVAKIGPPKAPFALRVSTTRQG